MRRSPHADPTKRGRHGSRDRRRRVPTPQLFGHPRPLWMLFMTEFWERFAFYGMRWALTLYIVAQFFSGDPSGQA